jgi:CD36 family
LHLVLAIPDIPFTSLPLCRELLSHENVTFNDNGTLTTIPHHPLEWRGELSEGRSEDDILYLPNIALLVSSNSHDTSLISEAN